MRVLGDPYCEVCGKMFAWVVSPDKPTVYTVNHVPTGCPNDNKTYSIELSSAALPVIPEVTG